MELANVLILAFKKNVECWLTDIGRTKESLVDIFFQSQICQDRKDEHDELCCCCFPAFAFLASRWLGRLVAELSRLAWHQPWHYLSLGTAEPLSIYFARLHFAFAIFAVTSRSIYPDHLGKFLDIFHAILWLEDNNGLQV